MRCIRGLPYITSINVMAAATSIAPKRVVLGAVADAVAAAVAVAAGAQLRKAAWRSQRCDGRAGVGKDVVELEGNSRRCRR